MQSLVQTYFTNRWEVDMVKIVIEAGSVTMEAELNDSPTARQIEEALPIEGRANTWGDEIYFEIPVVAAQASDARAQVEVGELGYWPVGRAFCIFFGPTPVSTDDRPRAYRAPGTPAPSARFRVPSRSSA